MKKNKKTEISSAHKTQSLSKSKSNNTEYWIAAGLTLITLVLYSSVSHIGFFTIDDSTYVTQNALVQHPDKFIWNSFVCQNYHPLTILSLACNFLSSGTDAGAYHITNLILHLINTVLWFVFLIQLTKEKWVSGLIALLFAIHPLHVESVVWIAERKDVLYTLFFAAGLILYLKYLNQKKISWLIITIIVFTLSLLSKPQAVIFPFLLLLLDYYTARKMDIKMWVEKIPFFALSLLFGIIALQSQKDAIADPLALMSWSMRPFLAAYEIALYGLKLLLPFKLSVFYPYPNEPLPFTYYLSAVILITVLYFIYKFRTNRELVFGSLFFLVCLLPVLQLKPFGAAIIAERYTYIASIGFFLPLVSFLFKYLKSKKSNFIFAGVLVYCIVLSCITYGRVSEWSNNKNLLKSADENYPSVFIKNTLANLYGTSGNLDSAKWYIDKAISEKPDLPVLYFTRAHMAGNNLIQGFADIDKAISLDHNYALAYGFKGLLWANVGNDDSAFYYLRKSISIRPLSDSYLVMGQLKEKIGQSDSASFYFNKAVMVDPTNLIAKQKAGIINP